jgi:RNA polymerase sigma factor (sigma-70 family)
MVLRDNYGNDQLVTDCLSGSDRAWTLFYRNHQGLVEVVVCRHVPFCSAEAREDIVQAVYVRLVESLETYDSSLSSLRTFVSLVAARTCIDWLRSQSTLMRTGQNVPISDDDDPEHNDAVLQSEFEPPDEAVAKAELALLIRRSLDRLSDTCRELLRLRFFLDLTYERIAAMLEKKENTINVGILRCLAQLKTAYHKVETEEPRP